MATRKTSMSRSEAGRKGAEARWGKQRRREDTNRQQRSQRAKAAEQRTKTAKARTKTTEARTKTAEKRSQRRQQQHREVARSKQESRNHSPAYDFAEPKLLEDRGRRDLHTLANKYGYELHEVRQQHPRNGSGIRTREQYERSHAVRHTPELVKEASLYGRNHNHAMKQKISHHAPFQHLHHYHDDEGDEELFHAILEDEERLHELLYRRDTLHRALLARYGDELSDELEELVHIDEEERKLLLGHSQPHHHSRHRSYAPF